MPVSPIPPEPAEADEHSLLTGSRLAQDLGWLVACVVALAPPLAWFSLGYSALDAEIHTKAQLRAEQVTRVISQAPKLWRYDEDRLRELVSRMPGLAQGEQARVLDSGGSQLASSAETVAAPVLIRSATLYDAGNAVGQVQVRQSLHGLLLGSAVTAVVGLLLALAVLATMGLLRRRENLILARMFNEQERARVTLHSIADAVITTDAQECITYLNPVAERLLLTDLASVRGQPLQRICPLADEHTLQAVPHPISAVLAAGTQADALGFGALANVATPALHPRLAGPATGGPGVRPGQRLGQRLGDALDAPGTSAAAEQRHVVLLRGDGSSLPIEHRSAPIHDRDGQLIGAVMVFHDVTAVRRLAQRISWTATHDALTGLVNRRELEARAAAARLSAANSGTSHVLCCVNLDQFKLVNDSFGHGAGDNLLKQVAVQLQSRLREADTLARLDGDAFGVLLEGCGLEAGERIAHGLLDALRGSRFSWEGRSFTLQASIGLAALDAESGEHSEVFAAADAACSAAKEQGRNRVCVFRGSDAAIAQRRNDMGWAARLKSALEEGRFRLYYQAYQALGDAGNGADSADGAIGGSSAGGIGAEGAHGTGASANRRHVEILLRLVDETGQTVAPGEFMPAAERYNVMPAIDRWVIHQVFSRYADLASQLGTPLLTCAVNLSGTSLNAEGLLDYIQQQSQLHQLPPGAVCFEITETAAIHNLQQAAGFMTAVKALGFSFALDDFGVGSSSFGYLKHLPVALLKIDGSFVRDMVQDPVDRAMVDTINRVGHIMGLKTVAEFAENAQIIDSLRKLGVDYAQGYGVHRPQPLPAPRPGPAPQLAQAPAPQLAQAPGAAAVTAMCLPGQTICA